MFLEKDDYLMNGSLFGASNDKSAQYDFLCEKETAVGLSLNSTCI